MVLWVGLPLGCLASSDIGASLLCFFPKSSSAVGVLLANCLPVGQVLCAVHNDDEGANDRTVEAHVGEDAGGMGTGDRVGLDHLDERVVERSPGESGVQMVLLLVLALAVGEEMPLTLSAQHWWWSI